MPRRELRHGQQVDDWLREIGPQLTQFARITLIGSGALLWHAYLRGISAELPDASMDVDPITDSDEVARICYDSLIGSDFERQRGWHVNLMPATVLEGFAAGWEERATRKTYGRLEVVAPHPEDLLRSKLKRREPRDLKHLEWAKAIGLVSSELQ